MGVPGGGEALPPRARKPSAAAHVAFGGEDAVGQVVDGEFGILGHWDERHAGGQGAGRRAAGCARPAGRDSQRWSRRSRPLRAPPLQARPSRADAVTQ